MESLFLKTPDGNLVNLSQIVFLEVEQIQDMETYGLWAYAPQARVRDGGTRFAARRIVYGDKEHCETALNELETVLKDKGWLHELKHSESFFVDEDDDEMEEETNENYDPPEPPQWFKNLPPNYDDDNLTDLY